MGLIDHLRSYTVNREQAEDTLGLHDLKTGLTESGPLHKIRFQMQGRTIHETPLGSCCQMEVLALKGEFIYLKGEFINTD